MADTADTAGLGDPASAQTKSLPSSDAASAFLEGEKGGGFALVTSTALRSVLIAPGLLLAGVPFKKALLASLLSSVSITTFILIYMSGKKLKARQDAVSLLGRRGGAPRQLNGSKYERKAWRAERRAFAVRGL